MVEYEYEGSNLGVEARWSTKAGLRIDDALMYE
jgi:hypothetical protein